MEGCCNTRRAEGTRDHETDQGDEPRRDMEVLFVRLDMVRCICFAQKQGLRLGLPSSIPNPDLRIGTKVILVGDIVSVVNSYPIGEIS